MEATPSDPALARLLPYVLYETLGPTLPDGLQGAAALWGLAQRCAMTYPDAVRRAGHEDGDALFDAIIEGRSGMTFTVDEYEDDYGYITHGRQADRTRDPGDAGGAARAGRQAAGLRPTTTFRSSSPSASGAPTPRTTSSAIRAGESATPTARCASAPRMRSASASTTAGARASRPHAAVPRRLVEVSDAMPPGHASMPNGLRPGLHRRGRRDARRRRRAELAHVVGLARRVRGHAMAQARAGAARARGLSGANAQEVAPDRHFWAPRTDQSYGPAVTPPQRLARPGGHPRDRRAHARIGARDLSRLLRRAPDPERGGPHRPPRRAARP